ncbi:TOG array regulator of axonemal microtubules protein 1-like [Labrus bergylta]|uniref:TOG array regulator of axonemal microtubules protein 1-like n=1 Tax=Labrus bergylta TaxID=56723 RepID=UPI0033137A88
MIQKGLENLHPHLLAHVPRPPGAPRQKKTVTSAARLRPMPPPKPVPPTNTGTPGSQGPVLPTPPAKPATSKMAKTSQRRSVHPLRTIGGGKKPASSCKPQTGGNIDLEELMPLPNPKESLTLFLDPVGSDDWEMKTKRLQSVQALVKHHPNTLRDKLQEVCYAVIEEVKNLRSSVASAAVDTIVSMYVYLQKDMDTMVDKTCCALLLKIAQSSVNVFLRQQANKALDSLVQNCSPAPVLNVLLRTGLSHLCAAVRASAAQKIHLLADSLGAQKIMSSGNSFKQSMVVAVNKICVDAAAEVRPHGLTILEDLAFQPNFMELWGRLVSQKDRPLLENILKKIKRERKRR